MDSEKRWKVKCFVEENTSGSTHELLLRSTGPGLDSNDCVHSPGRNLFTSAAHKAGSYTAAVQALPQVAGPQFRTQTCAILLITAEGREPHRSCSSDFQQIGNVTLGNAVVLHSHTVSKPKWWWNFVHWRKDLAKLYTLLHCYNCLMLPQGFVSVRRVLVEQFHIFMGLNTLLFALVGCKQDTNRPTTAQWSDSCLVFLTEMLRLATKCHFYFAIQNHSSQKKKVQFLIMPQVGTLLSVAVAQCQRAALPAAN